MFFKYFFCFGFLLVMMASSCSQDKGAHLSAEKMEEVLMDVQFAEIYSTMAKKDSTQSQGLKNNDSLAVFYKEVFRHHNITANQFIQSLDWYRQHPDVLDTVYNHVLATMDKVKK